MEYTNVHSRHWCCVLDVGVAVIDLGIRVSRECLAKEVCLVAWLLPPLGLPFPSLDICHCKPIATWWCNAMQSAMHLSAMALLWCLAKEVWLGEKRSLPSFITPLQPLLPPRSCQLPLQSVATEHSYTTLLSIATLESTLDKATPFITCRRCDS